ncbi:MAG: preprotein translocase subunit SecY [Lysobacterales bacterium 69-70]|nr:preprotein translocase subunit SecY [Xanthomonadaceae bacterium]ODU36000.1 MAG: preprotein translocase subunit SecY [Xanthomonadaceae bacterium SCN 69-320]ODV18256.1 MAG: preprotein translocase subunit SecY [Xanthomonadaceae bacterium SCN 69-25]OJY99539.1 MAG: preprotein translocase subunit SecY [Xanthomonadales bacterium 69-70]
MAANQANALASLGKFAEIKQRILFVIGALIVYRLGTFIPVPGVNPEAMTKLMESQGGIIDMFNMFSGGALSRFSIFALNVVPYISASIIVQLFTTVVPSLSQLRKEGESGRRTITKYTRIGAVGLAAFQAFGVSVALSGQQGVVYNPGAGFIFAAVVGLTAGTMFLMWLGEQITERGIGNGISLLIFAGIVAGLPGAVVHTLNMAREGQLNPLMVVTVLAIVLLVTAFVVFVERGQRRITVNYARRMGGAKAYMNQSSHLPLKLNMSGVIPAIFASSLIMFPATAATWFSKSGEVRWLQMLTTGLTPGQPVYMIVFAVLIVIFAFFYTALVFNSQETADNLKKQGALIPGIRPGKSTADYIDRVLTHLTAAGAIYLVAVCLIPDILRNAWNVPFYFGGTSLLIVVVVVMDFTAQVQAHLVSHQYGSLLKKSNLRGR